jgi:hypothetical protein
MSFGKISLLSKLFWLHSSTAGWHCSNSDVYRSNCYGDAYRSNSYNDAYRSNSYSDAYWSDTFIAKAITTEFTVLLCLSLKNLFFQNFFFLRSGTAGWHCSNSDAYRSNSYSDAYRSNSYSDAYRSDTFIAKAISTEFTVLCLLAKYLFYRNFFGYILALLGGTAAIVMPIGAIAIVMPIGAIAIVMPIGAIH